MTNPSRKPTEPPPARYYERVNARIDRLEDTDTYFYNLTNELPERVSTLKKKLELFLRQ